MHLHARAHRVDYSQAKDRMFEHTNTEKSPWYVVATDNEKSAHLSLMRHLLSLLPYEPIAYDRIDVPARQSRSYERPPKAQQTTVPAHYEVD